MTYIQIYSCLIEGAVMLKSLFVASLLSLLYLQQLFKSLKFIQNQFVFLVRI